MLDNKWVIYLECRNVGVEIREIFPDEAML
jgi:hypothetical protein